MWLCVYFVNPLLDVSCNVHKWIMHKGILSPAVCLVFQSWLTSEDQTVYQWKNVLQFSNTTVRGKVDWWEKLQ